MADVSVVIPTRNRSGLLRECVERLAAQTMGADAYEIIVVDDGSDAPPSQPLLSSPRVRLEVLLRPGRGPAAARNAGVEAASGGVIVFMGDDILAPPDFLEIHLRWHQVHPDPWVGMLGRAEWPAEYLRDDYMAWLNRSGLQFGYVGLTAGQRLRHYHFYTANISAKREILLDFPFDEDYSGAAYEDTDLGLRLERAGFQLYYHPESVAEHHHFYDLKSSCRHRRRVGRAGYLYQKKHPEHASFRWIRRLPAPVRWALGTQAYLRLADVARRSGDASLMAYYYYFRNSEAFWQGYAEAAAADGQGDREPFGRPLPPKAEADAGPLG